MCRCLNRPSWACQATTAMLTDRKLISIYNISWPPEIFIIYIIYSVAFSSISSNFVVAQTLKMAVKAILNRIPCFHCGQYKELLSTDNATDNSFVKVGTNLYSCYACAKRTSWFCPSREKGSVPDRMPRSICETNTANCSRISSIGDGRRQIPKLQTIASRSACKKQH